MASDRFLFIALAAGLVTVPQQSWAWSCWSEELTFEDCCGDPPRRSGCWTVEAATVGITREVCCVISEQQHSVPDSENVEALRVAITEASAMLAMGVKEDCQRALAQLLAGVPVDLSAYLDNSSTSVCENANQMLYFQTAVLETLLARYPVQGEGVDLLLARFEAAAGQLAASVLWQSHERVAEEARYASALLPAVQTESASERVHIAMVASIGKPPFGRQALAGIRSALFFATKRPLQFHLMVDEEGRKDVLRALGRLEPWLRSRGAFKLYGARELQRAWQSVYDNIPADCRNYGMVNGELQHHYGSPGFLRLFPHEIVHGVRTLVWVDAGDFVFLSDPANLLDYRATSGQEHLVAAPVGHQLPFQLFDLPRMRRANWSRLALDVFRKGYAAQGPKFCEFGEGNTYNELSRGPHRRLWAWLNSSWSYEPWEPWRVHYGLVDFWSHRKGAGFLRSIWQKRELHALSDYVSVRVHCPDFQEAFWVMALNGQGKSEDILVAAKLANFYHEKRLNNGSFEDFKGQLLWCNTPVEGVHFITPFHNVPWTHRFLNFWAGTDVWNDDWEKERDLRV